MPNLVYLLFQMLICELKLILKIIFIKYVKFKFTILTKI